MANKLVPNSADSQFFFTLVRARWLDGFHVVFGKVVKGMVRTRPPLVGRVSGRIWQGCQIIMPVEQNQTRS